MIESILLNRKAQARSIPDESGIVYYGGAPVSWPSESRDHYVDAYMDRVWVQRCVNLIATSVGQVEVKAMKGDEEVDPGHPLLHMLEQPNPRDPATKFFEATARWSQIVGDWFWELIPATGGGIAEAHCLRSHKVKIKPGSDGMPAGYLYDPNNNGNEIVLPAASPRSPRLKPNSVISGRFPSPIDDWYGMPPLRGAKDDVISEYYGVRYDHRFFHNSARPDLIVGFKDKLDEEQRKKNREAWREMKGVDRSHAAVVMDGDPKPFLVSTSPKDVEYRDGRLLAREGQCAAFGVPPVLVGDLTRATYSNYKESETIFWKETMLSLLDFLASWATAVLVPFYDDVDRIVFDTSGIQALQESENDKTDRVTKGVAGGVYTPNEGREMLDQEEIDDPEADRLHLQQNIVAITGEDPQPVVAQPVVDPPQLAAVKRMQIRTQKNQAFLGARALLFDKAIKHTVEKLAEILSNQGIAIAAIVAGKSRVTDLEAALAAYDWSKDANLLAAVVEALHFVVAQEASKQTGDILGIETVFDGESSRVQQMLRQLANRPDGITSVQGRIRDEVLAEVRKGIEFGVPNRGIATGGTFDAGPAGARDSEQVTIKGIQGVYKDYKTWQAERIARTECVAAYNRASADVMRDAGVEFVDILDGDGDKDCAEANGSRWTLNQFEQDPYAHPNCQRVGIPVLPEAVTADDLAQLSAPNPLNQSTHIHLGDPGPPAPGPSTLQIEAPPAPVVNVEPTEVKVDVAAPGMRKIEIQRDERGVMTGLLERPADNE